MIVSVIGSSSKGNCSHVKFENGVEIFLDSGISPSKITMKKSLKYVLVTHSHADHAKYAKELAEKYGCKIVLTQGTKDKLSLSAEYCVLVSTYEELVPQMALKYVNEAAKYPNEFLVVALKTYHDDPEPCAFAVFCGTEFLFYIMDTGRIPDTHRFLFDVIFVEANFTPKKLAESLANDDTNGLIAGRVNSGFGHVGLTEVYDAYKSILQYEPLILLGHRSAKNFDEKEYEEMPEDFKKCSRLIESGKSYSNCPF